MVTERDVFCDSSKALTVFFEEAKARGLIPPGVFEIADGIFVSSEDCQGCQVQYCVEHPAHQDWLVEWQNSGSPIPEEITLRANKPWA